MAPREKAGRAAQEASDDGKDPVCDQQGPRGESRAAAQPQGPAARAAQPQGPAARAAQPQGPAATAQPQDVTARTASELSPPDARTVQPYELAPRTAPREAAAPVADGEADTRPDVPVQPAPAEVHAAQSDTAETLRPETLRPEMLQPATQRADADPRAPAQSAMPAAMPDAMPAMRCPMPADPAAPAAPRARPSEGAAILRRTEAERSDIAAAWAALPDFDPDPRLLTRNRVVSFAGGPEAIPFDVMRTRLLQQMRANGWRRVAITSPNSACGKTTTTLNLAFGLARQSDVRTVVAEIDLRRPAIARLLGLRGGRPFAEVLDGRAGFAECAVRVGPNLAFATNAGAARNPAELLQNPGVGPALAAIEARYNPAVTIFDMPPMLVGDDAMAFMGQVDCVLLVAAAESTTMQEIDLCERDLGSQTNVLGVILNKCRYIDKSYGYSYYG